MKLVRLVDLVITDYPLGDILPLIESIDKIGFQLNRPLEVIRNDHGSYVVVNGRRRLAALFIIAERRDGSLHRACPSGLVPCRVL